MNAVKSTRHLWIASVLAVTAALLPLRPAFAFPGSGVFGDTGCGKIYTYNATNNWVWVTIYDVGKLTHFDWGWVGPHADRTWTAGGGPAGSSYLCGLSYYVRGEVKNVTAGSVPTGDPPNIFDTTVEVDPQTSGEGKDRVCITTSNNGRSYYWNYNDDCIKVTEQSANSATRVRAVKAAAVVKAVPLKPTPYPHPAVIRLSAAEVQAPFGPNSAVHYIDIVVDGKKQPAALGKLGKWSTTTPQIIQFADDAGGFRALKPGTGAVVWTYDGKAFDGSVHAQ